MVYRKGVMKKDIKNNDFSSAWNYFYEKGDNYLKSSSEGIIKSLYATASSQITLPEEEQLSILDFGCGDGKNIEIFDFNKHFVLGYDISTIAIKKASDSYPKCYFTTNKDEYLARKYHIVVADSCLDSMPWLDAVSSVTDIYGSLHTNGLFVLSLIESDSNKSQCDHNNSILIDNDFKKNTMQTYFDWVRIERLLLPMFDIISADNLKYTDSNGDLVTRWYISCRAF